MSPDFHTKIHESLERDISDIKKGLGDLTAQVAKIEGKIYTAAAVVGALVGLLPRILEFMK